MSSGKILAGVVVLLAVVAGGLAVYGSYAAPKRHAVEQTIPDARFPQ